MSGILGSSWRPIPKMVRCAVFEDGKPRCGALVFRRDMAQHLEDAHPGMTRDERNNADMWFVEPENPTPEDMKRKKR